MESRRQFLRTSATAMAASKGVLGANERIQLGVIGTGIRGSDVMSRFIKNEDCVVVALCDVAKNKLASAAATIPGNVATYGDYRRVLDRKDVDAVLIATPDHWHSQMTVDACGAGKDIYIEKPLSNTIPAAQRMLAAVLKYQRVAQVGMQQRSWPHFQECARMIRDGVLGPVTHAVIQFGGGYYASTLVPSSSPPADLDWESWQGSAPRHAYSPTRQTNWRAFYDYGGGLITDWGAHLIDTARQCLSTTNEAPLLTSASAQYLNVENPDHEQVPNDFVCS